MTPQLACIAAGIMLGSVQVWPLPGLWPSDLHGLHRRHYHMGLGNTPAGTPNGPAQGASR